MSVRDTLPAILRGEEATDLSTATRNRLDELAHLAQAEGLIVWMRDECAARMRQPHATWAVEYLLAAACALNGELERGHQTLLALGERLVEKKAWEPLAAVAEVALTLAETHAAARLLVRAHEGLKKEPARVEALGRAWALMPDDLELGLLLAVRLGEAGQAGERRDLLAELLQRFAAEQRWPGLEEAALEFAEHDDADGLVRLMETLPLVAEHGAFAECEQLVAIALPPLARADRAGEAYAPLRRVVALAAAAKGEGATEPFRGAMLTALRAGPGRTLPDVEGVLLHSRLTDAMQPLHASLERYDKIAALPPGGAVLHGSFGSGRVTSNDSENVVIDFARSRGHRMPYTAALRTLTPLAEDDLRLLQLTRPEEVARLRAEEPGEVLVRALRSLGGTADAEKLRVFLVGSGLLSAAEWTAFFRKARAAAEKDPRIDASRAFERHYALAQERSDTALAADDVPLPGLEPRKPAKTNLGRLRKFLVQHPAAEEALSRRFGKFVERTMLDPDAELGDRAHAGLHFTRWFPARSDEWVSVLRELWEKGLAISDLSGEDEQQSLLDASHAAGVEGDAILSALDSRFSAVRVSAERYREGLNDEGRREMRATLLAHAPRYPAAALRLLERELSLVGGADGWWLLWAALTVIEDRPKPSVADKVLGWLEPNGAFDRKLKGVPCPESLVLKFTVLLRQWRSSDRFLFPALDAAQRLGLAEAVETVRGARRKSSEKLFHQVGQQADVELSVMTRATWERLKVELSRLERELRTTIPATIQKARELGDLKENAEFHSAKLKQANVSKQVASLQQRLSRARFVEDAELQDGVVGLGTEVVLESDAELSTYWILGEDEQHHGEHVVSFQAPVGRALIGKTIGDEIDLDLEGRRRRYRVVSIERKLPPLTPDPAHDEA
jgi:transcription elongation factor GreA